MARVTCEGSNLKPLPIIQDKTPQHDCVLFHSRLPNGAAHFFGEGRGVCTHCHNVKTLLKSGLLPKHTRYQSWRERSEAQPNRERGEFRDERGVIRTCRACASGRGRHSCGLGGLQDMFKL